MTTLFESLDFFQDQTPHSAAFNMSADEALLQQIQEPMLRVYSWARPAVSFGYFEKYQLVHNAHPQRDLVRRWTGGGVVSHGEDWTYSLLVPITCDFTRLGTAESYRAIHDALAVTLRDAGLCVAVADTADEKISQACFENPVRYDVISGGRKIAGAAQRRTNVGLLHQGSIQGVNLPDSFGFTFASALAAKTGMWKPDAGFTEAAHALEKKYASREWLERF